MLLYKGLVYTPLGVFLPTSRLRLLVVMIPLLLAQSVGLRGNLADLLTETEENVPLAGNIDKAA